MRVPTLALCVPAYKAAWCLPRLLGSASRQEIAFDEILVYDDASPDDTADVARTYGATVIRGSRNIGCSAGKNLLLQAAHSDWIHFHDADDELLPNFTRLAHKWMIRRAKCPDVVLFNYEYRDHATGALIQTRYFDGAALRKDAIEYAIREQINPFCGLYRRSKLTEIGGYDTSPEILYNEDVAFHCKLAVAGLSFDAESEVSIINYRVGGSMSSGNYLKCIQAQHQVMRRLASRVDNAYALAISSRLWHIAGILAAYGCWTDVDDALALANRIAPGPPPDTSTFFASLARLAGPQNAFRIREFVIRLCKPWLRRNRT